MNTWLQIIRTGFYNSWDVRLLFFSRFIHFTLLAELSRARWAFFFQLAYSFIFIFFKFTLLWISKGSLIYS